MLSSARFLPHPAKLMTQLSKHALLTMHERMKCMYTNA